MLNFLWGDKYTIQYYIIQHYFRKIHITQSSVKNNNSVLKFNGTGIWLASNVQLISLWYTNRAVCNLSPNKFASFFLNTSITSVESTSKSNCLSNNVCQNFACISEDMTWVSNQSRKISSALLEIGRGWSFSERFNCANCITRRVECSRTK